MNRRCRTNVFPLAADLAESDRAFSEWNRGMQTDNDASSTVTLERHPQHRGAVTLRFNRPKVRNALRGVDFDRFGRLLAEVENDVETRLIIVTGTANAFCAGADINDLNAMSGDTIAAYIQQQVNVLARITMTPKIVLAAVNGAASGFGNHLITCADLCVMREDAVMHFTGAAKAIPSLLMGALIMPMTIGLKRAKMLYLRGGRLDAAQAVQDGLCNYAVKVADWEAELDKLAAEFSARAPSAMAHNKFQLNQCAFQMLGAARLSGLAGAATLSQMTDIPTGKLKA